MRFWWRAWSLGSVIFLLAACNTSLEAVAPTATLVPVPPTATPTQELPTPTSTPIPATSTPIPGPPSATATLALPTATSTPILPTVMPDFQQFTYEQLVHVFDYDSQMPLDIQEEAVSDEDGVKVYDITYAGANGDRVKAFLIVPPGEGPFAGILFLHWGAGSRYQFLDEAILLANKGVVSLLVQGTYNPEFNNFTRTIINLRRGADLLASRPDVDSSRLAYVGHSWAGTFGGILAGVDRRFKTYVLMAGVPYWSKKGEINKMIPLDGIRYVGQAAPASLFFQCAERDQGVTHETAQEYYEAGSEPKRIEWYDAGHRLNEEAQQDRLEWLSEELKLP